MYSYLLVLFVLVWFRLSSRESVACGYMCLFVLVLFVRVWLFVTCVCFVIAFCMIGFRRFPLFHLVRD